METERHGLSEAQADELGKVAYDAYCRAREWKAFDGQPLPHWGVVKEEIKVAWRATAKAVVLSLVPRTWFVKYPKDGTPIAFPTRELAEESASDGEVRAVLGLSVCTPPGSMDYQIKPQQERKP